MSADRPISHEPTPEISPFDYLKGLQSETPYKTPKAKITVGEDPNDNKILTVEINDLTGRIIERFTLGRQGMTAYSVTEHEATDAYNYLSPDERAAADLKDLAKRVHGFLSESANDKKD